MKLIDNWRTVLRKAWSIRVILLSAALTGVEMALPLFTDAFPRNVFLGLSIVVAIAAAVFRIIAQPKTIGGQR